MNPSLRPSLNWLFVFVPVSVALDHFGGGKVSPPLLFFAAALAIIPIARLIVHATEQLSLRTGDAIGGLLNATFGNAPELIIAIVALRAGLLDMVRASLIGAILANVLLALGVSFLVGGVKHHTQQFNANAARAYGAMMLIAVISLAMPSAFSRFFAPESTVREEGLMNLIVALVLLLAYGLYLVFVLRTHPDVFASVGQTATKKVEEHHDGEQWSVGRAVGSLLGASVLAAWMSEILVGAAEGTGQALGMSPTFIGIVFLAIVGGAAESGSAIAMAGKDKMDLTVGIAMGSSIQIALFVAPVLVLVSCFIAPHPLELSFNRAEIGSLFLAMLMGMAVTSDGQSNWYKGVQLIAVYAIIALMFFFMPEVAH